MVQTLALAIVQISFFSNHIGDCSSVAFDPDLQPFIGSPGINTHGIPLGFRKGSKARLGAVRKDIPLHHSVCHLVGGWAVLCAQWSGLEGGEPGG